MLTVFDAEDVVCSDTPFGKHKNLSWLQVFREEAAVKNVSQPKGHATVPGRRHCLLDCLEDMLGTFFRYKKLDLNGGRS